MRGRIEMKTNLNVTPQLGVACRGGGRASVGGGSCGSGNHQPFGNLAPLLAGTAAGGAAVGGSDLLLSPGATQLAALMREQGFLLSAGGVAGGAITSGGTDAADGAPRQALGGTLLGVIVRILPPIWPAVSRLEMEEGQNAQRDRARLSSLRWPILGFRLRGQLS